MVICGSLAKNDELTFIKFMKKLTQYHIMDKRDRVAIRLLNVIQQSTKDAKRELPFEEIRSLTYVK